MFMKFKIYLLIALGLCSLNCLAQSKQDVLSMLNAMEKSDTFTSEQIAAAKKELEKMDEKELEELVQKGQKLKNDPGIGEKLKEMGLPAK